MRSLALLALVVSLPGTTRLPLVLDVPGVARSGDQPAARAVVWLTAPGVTTAAEPRRVVLDQRNLRFDPQVLVVQVGTTVELPNNDRVLHNVFSFRDGKRFDLGLYPVGTVRRVTFDRPGVSRVFCNIHPNMAAYVVAVDTPLFAVTDEAGRFTLRAVPRGEYAYHAWRPAAAELRGTLTIDESANLEIAWP